MSMPNVDESENSLILSYHHFGLFSFFFSFHQIISWFGKHFLLEVNHGRVVVVSGNRSLENLKIKYFAIIYISLLLYDNPLWQWLSKPRRDFFKSICKNFAFSITAWQPTVVFMIKTKTVFFHLNCSKFIFLFLHDNPLWNFLLYSLLPHDVMLNPLTQCVHVHCAVMRK